MSVRQERVASEIQKVVSERLVRGIKSPLPAFVTIAHVEISKDMSVAKVFYSLFGSEADCKVSRESLELEKRTIRQEVGKKVRLRITPDLKFVEDDTPKKAARIHELLAEAPVSDDE